MTGEKIYIEAGSGELIDKITILKSNWRALKTRKNSKTSAMSWKRWHDPRPRFAELGHAVPTDKRAEKR